MKVESAQPVCYVTTRGRVSGADHTIEIWYVEQGGCIYLLSGNGARADWVRNLEAMPQAVVALAPDGPGGHRSDPVTCSAVIGPLPDELHVRQAMEARYHGWQPGQPLSAWASESLVVRLCAIQ